MRLLENEFVRFSPPVIPAASNSVRVAVIPKNSRLVTLRPVQLYAMAKGSKERVGIVPSDEYNQAFAWDHLLPSRAFLLASPKAQAGLKNAKKPAKGAKSPAKPQQKLKNL